jgi:hypothetical protein
MMLAIILAFAGVAHARLRGHLFPGDGREAAAIALCARSPGPRLRLLVREILPVPYEACASREPDGIVWPGECVEHAIDRGMAEGLAIMLVHSHPGGLFGFSRRDDASDRQVIPALFQAYGDLHGSAVMTPDGAVRARVYGPDMFERAADLVTAAGDDIAFWWADATDRPSARPAAFTSAMTEEMGRLHAVVVGVSGTGSIQAEQAARLGFGRVTLIDFDVIKRRNLNRILNATLADAVAERLKVEAFAAAIDAHRGPGTAIAIPEPIGTRDAVLAAGAGDVLFSCVDSLEGRHVIDRLAAAFLMPLFDVGVTIPVRRAGEGIAIADAVGRIDYVQPGGATLGDRQVYTPSSLRAEYLRAAAPEAHAHEVAQGYLSGAVEEAPSVVTLNMRAASACMNEWILRAYPFRHEPNARFARTLFSLATAEEEHLGESFFPAAPNESLARGLREPLLGLPSLAVNGGAP